MGDDAELLRERLHILEADTAALQEVGEALCRHEREYLSTLDNLLVGVVVHGPDTSIQYSNPEASRILGLTQSQMIGKTAVDSAWRFIREDESVIGVADYPVNRVFATRAPLHNYEIGIRRPDRDYVTWGMVNAIPIFADSGQIEKVIVNFVDLTDRKRAEVEKLALERTLRQTQKMDALGTLAGGIAHDFNNLLTPILGYIDLIRMGRVLPEPEASYLQHVEDSAKLARDLVKRILQFSRNSAPDWQPVNLAVLIAEALTLVRASTPDSVTLKTDFAADLPPVLADSSQICQVILNLCINAVQAMETGGEVVVRLRRIDGGLVHRLAAPTVAGYVCLTVADSGCGMDAKTRERIFEPFFTTKDAGETRGTGLGLSIVLEILKQHGAHIEVDSTPGLGTAFHIYFPVGPPA